MFLLLHNIAIRAYILAIRLAALWNPKARSAIRGRQNILQTIAKALRHNDKPVLWMHAASLGEFEQGRFLLESIREKYPNYCIVVTFFSPSGYEVAKHYKGADHIFYLPFPIARQANRFINLINPKLVLWIKYDYWYHYLTALKKRNIPVLLISAIFHRYHPFFKWYGGMHRKMLSCFSWLFVQTSDSAKRLSDIGFSKNVIVSGDTRFDRVIDIASHFVPVPGIAEFTGHHQVIVAGSTWPDDEEELDHFANTNKHIRFIIAPHQVDEEHLKNIEELFKFSIRYSQLKGQPDENINTLIIDNIGMLSRLYHYATIAYIGGGFGSDGIHNILEAAVYGKPVVFGPVFNQYREAIELLEEGGAFTIDNALELEKTLNDLLSNTILYNETCEAAERYIHQHKGATQSIMEYIQANRLLTS